MYPKMENVVCAKCELNGWLALWGSQNVLKFGKGPPPFVWRPKKPLGPFFFGELLAVEPTTFGGLCLFVCGPIAVSVEFAK